MERRIQFVYRIQDLEGKADPILFDITLDPVTLEHVDTWAEPYPEWTALDHHQCEGCPLEGSGDARCPAAKAIVPLVHPFEELMSYHDVRVTVTTPERTYTHDTSVQRALSSILGLQLATSGCPVLGQLKPMARFHLPFSSTEETFFRAAGAWLLMNYLSQQHGDEATFDLQRLRALYNEIHNINVAIAKRLRNEVKSDAGLNAITLLDLLAQGMPISIEDNLAELEYIYQAIRPMLGAK